jgi:hypothetical protein
MYHACCTTDPKYPLRVCGQYTSHGDEAVLLFLNGFHLRQKQQIDVYGEQQMHQTLAAAMLLFTSSLYCSRRVLAPCQHRGLVTYSAD